MAEKVTMPIKRFVQLMNDAEKAVKEKDLARVEAINAELEPVGYRIIVEGDNALVQQIYG